MSRLAVERAVFVTIIVILAFVALRLDNSGKSGLNFRDPLVWSHGYPIHMAMLVKSRVDGKLSLIDIRCERTTCDVERVRPVPDKPEIWFAVRPREM